MTEELEKEAEEWLNKWEFCNKCQHKAECIEEYSYCHLVVNRAYLAGAEPREKRIAELEAQIEKMKCCYNCSKWNDGQCADIPDSGYCCADFVCEDWEIKEK